MKLTIEDLKSTGFDLSTAAGFASAETAALKKKMIDAEEKKELKKKALADYCNGKSLDEMKFTLMKDMEKKEGKNLAIRSDFESIEAAASDLMQRQISIRFLKLAFTNSATRMTFSKQNSLPEMAENLSLTEQEIYEMFPGWSPTDIKNCIQLYAR